MGLKQEGSDEKQSFFQTDVVNGLQNPEGSEDILIDNPNDPKGPALVRMVPTGVIHERYELPVNRVERITRQRTGEVIYLNRR